MELKKIFSKRVIWSVVILFVLLIITLTFIIKNISLSDTNTYTEPPDELPEEDYDEWQDENSEKSDTPLDFLDFGMWIWIIIGYIIWTVISKWIRI